MKQTTVFLAICSIGLLGCTSPTQRLAAEALTRGVAHTHNIVYDLANEAKQAATDAADDGVRQAVRDAVTAANNGDVPGIQEAEDRAAAIANKAFNKCNRINWLQIQWERARAYIRLGQTYVWSQKGVFDITFEELKKAKQQSDQKYQRGDIQKATLNPVAHEEIDRLIE